MKSTIKSIKINGDGYPSIVANIYEKGADFHDGKLEGTKKAGESLIEAMNRLMSIVHEACNLGDKWLDELGDFSRVSGVIFKDEGVVITAQLQHDYGDSVKAAIANSPYIKYDELLVHENSSLDALRQEVKKYLDTLPVQKSVFDQSAAAA
ncbi:MAG: hypothetical protein AAGA46_00110 [Cyanobacteria bacterium P01_F01_bin.13]